MKSLLLRTLLGLLAAVFGAAYLHQLYADEMGPCCRDAVGGNAWQCCNYANAELSSFECVTEPDGSCVGSGSCGGPECYRGRPKRYE
jgi:hypothetical protein